MPRKKYKKLERKFIEEPILDSVNGLVGYTASPTIHLRMSQSYASRSKFNPELGYKLDGHLCVTDVDK